MKILSPWPWPQGHPRGGDGADNNFSPISTIMPNMIEIHQRVFKIWVLVNFNAKTLTLWRKDERTYERTYVRTNEQMDEQKSENYIPPHTLYVGGIIICLCIKVIIAKMSGKKMTEGQILILNQIYGQITILNQIVIISMHIASLVKRPCYLLKLSSGNENMGMFRANNSVKIGRNLPISNPKPDLHI